MQQYRRILITGCAGYIGSVLTRLALSKGYFVKGFDNLMYGGESLLSVYDHPNFEFNKGDIRIGEDIVEALKEVDAVIHLAAIVGDPACARDPVRAEEVNWKGTQMLIDYSVQARGVKRFIYASTCSNYGKMEGMEYVNEDSPLRPVSLYAELKVKSESYLLDSKSREDFVPVSLRFATAYGLSQRMRFDLTVNEFMRDVALGRELRIFGEEFWRPYCHVQDLARACLIALESDRMKVDHKVFGVGSTEENYQKKRIAEEILKIVPVARVSYVHIQEDMRDYKVDFSRIRDELGFRISTTLREGLREIHSALKQGIFSDPFAGPYRNT